MDEIKTNPEVPKKTSVLAGLSCLLGLIDFFALAIVYISAALKGGIISFSLENVATFIGLSLIPAVLAVILGAIALLRKSVFLKGKPLAIAGIILGFLWIALIVLIK